MIAHRGGMTPKAEQPKVEQWMREAAREIFGSHPLGTFENTVEVHAKIIASYAPTPAPSQIRNLLLRAIVEMEYMRAAETSELVSSSEGAAIIREGMAALGLKDLSEEEVARVRVATPSPPATRQESPIPPNPLTALAEWERDTGKPATASEGNAFIDGFNAATLRVAPE